MSSAINLKTLNFGPDSGIMEGSGGLQAYIDQSSVLTAVNGAPATGQYRSSITRRADIPNITTDLKASMGIERIPVQQIYEIQTERGSSGEAVFGVLNDDKGLIRFVGLWSNVTDTNGARALSSVSTDYIEIVFYGTGLNLLANISSSSDIRATVDGGAEGSNLVNASQSSILSGRNSASNIIIPLASGLTLGLHTIKVRYNAVGAAQGFEILNVSSSINVNPGSAYSQFKKGSLVSASSVAYNSNFVEILKDGASSGSLGTRGARVISYFDPADGTIKKKAVAVNSAAAYMSSANHGNEEIIRRYHFREFGAGRNPINAGQSQDDFSLMAVGSGSTNRAFTLDDGITTLTASAIDNGSTASEYLRLGNASSFITFTFIGTGVDYIIPNISGTVVDNIQIYIDGVNVGNVTGLSRSAQTRKIASGLPYGTHTLKIAQQSASPTNTESLHSFIVFGPKKPTLPSGTIELADYNIVADYDGTAAISTTDNTQVPQGVISKTAVREHTYIGAGWTIDSNSLQPSCIGGFIPYNGSSSQPVKYTFFGTGCEILLACHVGSTTDFTVTIDGSLNASGVARSNATNLGGGSYRVASGAAYPYPCRVEFTGLSLDVHTIVIQRSGGTGNLNYQGLHIITPIHSHKSNLYADLQNTLPVGSCSLSDSRKFSVVKDAPSSKAWAQAVGVTSNPGTTSTTSIPCPDMSLSVKTSGNPVQISYSIALYNSGANNTYTQVYINGIATGALKSMATGNTTTSSDTLIVQLPAGTHKIDVYWYVAAGTGTAWLTGRNLTVKEL